jgi:hypothetical protein
MFWIQTEEGFKGQYLPDNVDYHPSFLELSPSQPLPPGFEGVGHAEGSPLDINPTIIITTYAFSKGYHCVMCGRLSCRYVSWHGLLWAFIQFYFIRSQWEHWRCPTCGVNMFNDWPISLADVRIAQLVCPNQPSWSERVVWSSITHFLQISWYKSSFRYLTFLVPDHKLRLNFFRDLQGPNGQLYSWKWQRSSSHIQLPQWKVVLFIESLSKHTHNFTGARFTTYSQQHPLAERTPIRSFANIKRTPFQAHLNSDDGRWELWAI